MEKEPTFFGPRSYTEKEEKIAQKALGLWREKGRTPEAGEMEPTEQDRLMIETVRSFLVKELKSLGFDSEIDLDPSQFHFYDAETFKEKFPEHFLDTYALMNGLSQSISLNRERLESPAKKFSTLLHESIHLVSFQRNFLEKKDKKLATYDARLGYRLRSPWKKGRQDFFRGLNEVVTDIETYQILKEHEKELEEQFKITPEEIDGAIYGYMGYAAILNAIINKIAERSGRDGGEILQTFEKGLFKGNLLHLQEIDKVFGKGSLRLLSFLSSCETEEKNKQVEPLIKMYFTAENEEDRATAKAELYAIVNGS